MTFLLNKFRNGSAVSQKKSVSFGAWLPMKIWNLEREKLGGSEKPQF